MKFKLRILSDKIFDQTIEVQTIEDLKNNKFRYFKSIDDTVKPPFAISIDFNEEPCNGIEGTITIINRYLKVT